MVARPASVGSENETESKFNQGFETMKGAKLQTNLVGRRIHLLTDQEARIEISKQEKPPEKEVLDVLTAEMLYPALKAHKKRFEDQSGEIVAVRSQQSGDKSHLIYTISFGGELVELHSALWRLDPV